MSLVIETRTDGLAEAVDRAVAHRRAGRTFEAVLHLPEDRASIANLAALELCCSEADITRRAPLLEGLAAHDARVGRAMLEDLSTVGREARDLARVFVRLAQTTRLTSWAMGRRLVFALDTLFSYVVAEPVDGSVPAPDARPAVRERIVLWAPEDATDGFVLALAGACADGSPVDAVCRGGDTFGYDVRIIRPNDAAETLSRADVVVAVNPDDCGAALALSCWGRALCAPATSGIDLWLRGVVTYRPWSAHDLTTAIRIARGRPARFDRIFAAETQTLGAPEPPAPRNGSPVRVIVRTTRPQPTAATAAALASLAWKPLEIELVSDEKTLLAAARREGATYVLVLDDGYAPYPEAIGRLVRALERSGEAIAAGDVLETSVGERGTSARYRLGHPLHAHVLANPLLRGALFRRDRLADALDPRAATVVRVDAVLGALYRRAP